MEKQPIVVSAEVFEGLEAVRTSGLTNMFDRPRVIEIAEMMGYYETADWLIANRNLYSRGLFQGFITAEEAKETKPCVD